MPTTPKVDHKGRTKSAAQPFAQVLKPTLQEPGWKALPYGARCLYITLKSFFTGSNNGRLSRNSFAINDASNDSPFVHGLTDQYITDRAQRKLDAHLSPCTSNETPPTRVAIGGAR